jgi:maltooligosyltrehalose trehalohydrolase
MHHRSFSSTSVTRRRAVGAEPLSTGGAHFRVWAPDKDFLQLVFCDRQMRPLSEIDMEREENGYYWACVAAAQAGALYGFRVETSTRVLPDPASRFQPEGPEGPSQIIDPRGFPWTDQDWQGPAEDCKVIYEMHIGTFTPEGTYAAAATHLRKLADLGVTVLEVMPLADFPGRFGWGYDGVCWFAPTRLYGGPDDLRRFIDQAHAFGIAVILDVVYNHFGPVAQHVEEFSDYYLSADHTTDWGKGINYDGPCSEGVREFVLTNVAHWIEEYHLDGLRIDASQDIRDSSPENILAAISRQVRESGQGRATLVVAENEPQDSRLVDAHDAGGCGMDALWNDDFHHSAMVRLTGRSEAYFTDYQGTPQEFVSLAKYGHLYQGQWYRWQKKPRGQPAIGRLPSTVVNFIQNHDQVANSLAGLRGHQQSNPGCFRAMTALLLLAPGTPMLFQGQEFASSRPFRYFADLGPEKAGAIRGGREKFLAQFPSLAAPESRARLSDPTQIATFTSCKLDFSERDVNCGPYALHRDLLRLRRDDPVFSRPRCGGVDGAVLGPAAFALRYFGDEGDDRLLLINFGIDLRLSPIPEPLLAPSRAGAWQLIWSSEDPGYGGTGTPPLRTDADWIVPGAAALVLAPPAANR